MVGRLPSGGGNNCRSGRGCAVTAKVAGKAGGGRVGWPKDTARGSGDRKECGDDLDWSPDV